MEKPNNDIEVKKAKNEIITIWVVPKILAKQDAQGYWETTERFYTAKYKGTEWQLIILAEHGADGRNEGVKKACEAILENFQDHKSGGFSIYLSARKGGGRHGSVIPCLTGNMVWSLIKLGYLEDPRVKRGLDWIATYQRFYDRAESRPKGWPYDKTVGRCFEKHSCHMGVVKALKALGAIPVEKRSEAISGTIERGAEYMLIHHIHKRSHNLNRVSKPDWLRFGFPLMYQTDVLEILYILTKLGFRDE